jgi:hypothetical protein
MEKKTNPINCFYNEPAFPKIGEAEGLTKREYFAALAMQGLLTRVPKRHGDETDLGIIEAQRIAAESRIMADLLIAELNLEEEDGGNNE